MWRFVTSRFNCVYNIYIYIWNWSVQNGEETRKKTSGKVAARVHCQHFNKTRFLTKASFVEMLATHLYKDFFSYKNVHTQTRVCVCVQRWNVQYVWFILEDGLSSTKTLKFLLRPVFLPFVATNRTEEIMIQIALIDIHNYVYKETVLPTSEDLLLQLLWYIYACCLRHWMYTTTAWITTN